jgi:hypothetical protein
MRFDWGSLRSLADKLAEDEGYDRETRFRTAATRYYYCAHWLVRKLVERRNPGIQWGEPWPRMGRRLSIHKEVILHCLDNSNATMRVIGEHLGRLFENRIRADYRDQATFSYTDLCLAKRLCASIESGIRKIDAGKLTSSGAEGDNPTPDS